MTTTLGPSTASRSSSLTSLERMDSGEFSTTALGPPRTTIPKPGAQISCCLTQSQNTNSRQSK